MELMTESARPQVLTPHICHCCQSFLQSCLTRIAVDSDAHVSALHRLLFGPPVFLTVMVVRLALSDRSRFALPILEILQLRL